MLVKKQAMARPAQMAPYSEVSSHPSSGSTRHGVTDHEGRFGHHGRFLLDGQRSGRDRIHGHLVAVNSHDIRCLLG